MKISAANLVHNEGVLEKSLEILVCLNTNATMGKRRITGLVEIAGGSVVIDSVKTVIWISNFRRNASGVRSWLQLGLCFRDVERSRV
jgi:hypothetical protein